MTIALDATWSGGTANTYITLDSANTYITSAILDNSAWTSATTVTQTAALLGATIDIDSRQYIYDRWLATQRLEFPRNLGTFQLPNSWNVSSLGAMLTRMQEQVQNAQCYQAVYLLKQNTNSVHKDLLESGVAGFTRTVGPVTESYKYSVGTSGVSASPGSSKNRLCAEALALLSDWMSSKRIFRA